MRRRVAGNLLWMLAERGFQIGIGIAVVAMLARALGPAGFARSVLMESRWLNSRPIRLRSRSNSRSRKNE